MAYLCYHQRKQETFYSAAASSISALLLISLISKFQHRTLKPDKKLMGLRLNGRHEKLSIASLPLQRKPNTWNTSNAHLRVRTV